uniref:non-specific serine/threonine protein kinase n=1 Tax=Strigamia maritima TaxID=126957 RepID=T1IK00_STRMM
MTVYERYESSRRTLVVIPNSRVMVRSRKLPTINSLDGGVGAVGGDIVNEIVSSPQQQPLNPAALQNKLFQTGLTQALLKVVCKWQYEDEASQKNLFEVINKHFKGKKTLPINTETEVPLLSLYFEKVIENLRNVFMEKNSSLLLNSWIILNTNDNLVTYHLYKKPKYCEMFSDISKIARGGGGTVCKARHNVDQCYYAIKIIPWPLEPRQDEVLREAIYLAKLDHPNIVMYKTAWFDHCTDQDCIGSTESSPASNPSDFSIDSSCNNINENATAPSSADNSIVFEDIEPSTSSPKRSLLTSAPRKLLRSTSYESRLRDSEMGSEMVEYKGRGDNASFLGLCNDRANDGCEPCQNVLIIQMELCRYTLMDFLDDRIKSSTLEISDIFTLVDEKKMMEILQSILKAINYYHSRHPKNILFDKNDEVKIGDFGLATTKLLKEDIKNQSFRLRHTSNIGTMPYAAPEQVEGSNYSYKVDMYSLGIIIIELFYPFKTNMEKSEVLHQFKNENVPKSFLERWPMQAALILKLLSKDPSVRPSAIEVLRSDLFNWTTREICQHIPPKIPDIIISQYSSDEDMDLEDMDLESLKFYTRKLKKNISIYNDETKN